MSARVDTHSKFIFKIGESQNPNDYTPCLLFLSATNPYWNSNRKGSSGSLSMKVLSICRSTCISSKNTSVSCTAKIHVFHYRQEKKGFIFSPKINITTCEE